MTSERRTAKRTLRSVVKANFSFDFLLTATPRQMEVASWKITDQLLAGKNPSERVPFAP